MKDGKYLRKGLIPPLNNARQHAMKTELAFSTFYMTKHVHCHIRSDWAVNVFLRLQARRDIFLAGIQIESAIGSPAKLVIRGPAG